MSGVRRSAEDPDPNREQSIRGRCYPSRYLAKKSTSKKKNQRDGAQVYKEQSQVDTRLTLAEDGQYEGIRCVSPGKFHVRGKPEWRHAIEHKMPGVGILAFIAFQWNIA